MYTSLSINTVYVITCFAASVIFFINNHTFRGLQFVATILDLGPLMLLFPNSSHNFYSRNNSRTSIHNISVPRKRRLYRVSHWLLLRNWNNKSPNYYTIVLGHIDHIFKFHAVYETYSVSYDLCKKCRRVFCGLVPKRFDHIIKDYITGTEPLIRFALDIFKMGVLGLYGTPWKIFIKDITTFHSNHQICINTQIFALMQTLATLKNMVKCTTWIFPDITTSKQSTTKTCAHCVGHTVSKTLAKYEIYTKTLSLLQDLNCSLPTYTMYRNMIPMVPLCRFYLHQLVLRHYTE